MKSGDTLKTWIGRGQLSFASDNPSSNPNAYPLIFIFPKPHSEVASATHTYALKRFRKDPPQFSDPLFKSKLPANPDLHR